MSSPPKQSNMSRKRKLADFKEASSKTGYISDALQKSQPTKRRKSPSSSESEEQQFSKPKVPAKKTQQARKEPKSKEPTGYQTEAAGKRGRNQVALSSDEENIYVKTYNKRRPIVDSAAANKQSTRTQQGPKISDSEDQLKQADKKNATAQKAPALQKPIEKWSDQNLVQLLENHLLQVFSTIKNAPSIINTGEVISRNYDASKRQVTMYLQEIEFQNEKKVSLRLEAGRLIDYYWIQKTKSQHDFHPQSRYLFLTQIQVNFTVTAKDGVIIECHLPVISTLGKDKFSKDPTIAKGVSKIKDTFGSSFQEKNANVVVFLSNYDQQTIANGITLESLAHDWQRLYKAEFCDSELMANNLNNMHQGGKNGINTYVVMKYGFDYSNTDNLFTMLVCEASGSVDIQNCEYQGKKASPERKKPHPKQPKPFLDIDSAVQKRLNKTQGFETEIEGPIKTTRATKKPFKANSPPKQEFIMPQSSARSQRIKKQTPKAQQKQFDSESDNDMKGPAQPEITSEDNVVSVRSKGGQLKAVGKTKVANKQKNYQSDDSASKKSDLVVPPKSSKLTPPTEENKITSENDFRRRPRRAIRSESEEAVQTKRPRSASSSQASKSFSDNSEPKPKTPRQVGRRNQNSTILEVDEKQSDVEMLVESSDEEPAKRGLRNMSIPLIMPKNNYDSACQKLQLNAIPDYLPCREKERQQIIDYITQGVKNQGSSSSLYISGMPGTGKTATTLEVINTLRIKKLNFSFLHINAMSLTNPNLVYTIIYESITGRRVAPASAALFLDEFFKKKDKTKLLTMEMNKGRINSKQEVSRNAEKMRVVLVDELDALVTKKQTLLYNLFDWPCHQNSKLLVISIANTMDLPERMQVKISSRIGNNRLVYEPYNLQQILTILKSRLRDVETIFEGRSLDFVARKVSMYSGDIRRSLQITKRAVELCRDRHQASCLKEDAPLTKVVIQDVIGAFDELFNSKTVKVLSTLQRNEVVAILALHHELHVSKSERVNLDNVHDRCNAILRQVLGWSSKIQTNIFREIIKRLQAFGLVNLTIEHCKITENVHLQLMVFGDELVTAFKDKDYVIKVAAVFQPLKELFADTQKALELKQ